MSIFFMRCFRHQGVLLPELIDWLTISSMFCVHEDSALSELRRRSDLSLTQRHITPEIAMGAFVKLSLIKSTLHD